MGADAWDEVRVARWLSQSEGLDRQMAPITDALFESAALQPGERVLDVGCGHGPTTRRAAIEVGGRGAVVGVDIAAPMLAAAASVTAATGSAPIEWVEADVCSWVGPSAAFDAVISRFGVMFFADPVAAFTNLVAAVQPGGRLAMATWAHMDRSDIFTVPLSAAVPALEAEGITPAVPPVDGGAFTLGTADKVKGVLEPAGWQDVTTVEYDVRLPVGGGLAPVAAAVSAIRYSSPRI
jgi:cyclopropane fatty-acyl-phospholipid synthase-like methyltransferase